MADRRRQMHEILLIEQDTAGVWEVRCRCGEVTWTAHGEGHATEMGRNHLYMVGQQGGRVVR